MSSSPRVVTALVLGSIALIVSGGSGQSTARKQRVSAPDPQAIDLGLQGSLASRKAGLARGGVPRYESNRVIVKFRPGVEAAGRRRLAQARQMSLAQPRTFANFDVLSLDAGQNPAEIANDLSGDADVEYTQPSYLRQALDVPNDPLFSSQWNMTLLRMPRAWDINHGATPSVVVAVIDSGIAFQTVTYEFDASEFRIGTSLFRSLGRIAVPFAAAPDLDSPGRFVDPFDFVWNDENPVDMEGHGTHVSGTIGQNTGNLSGVSGMAFNVRIMPLKVLSNTWDFIFGAVQDCCGATDIDIAAAIRYAAIHGADVINLSLGGPGGPAPVLEDAIRFAVANGSVIAMAGGNDFEEGNLPDYPAAIGQRVAGALAVGAVGRDSRRAYYSNTSSGIEVCAPGGNQRRDGESGGVLQQKTDDLEALTYLRGPQGYAAPRFNVMVYEYFQGTSMAAPHVAGLAALLMSQGITRPAAVEAAIKQFAKDVESAGVDSSCGHGLIDPVTTLRGLGVAR